MNDSVFAELRYWLMVAVSIILPFAIYGVLQVKQAISRRAVLALAFTLIAIAGFDVYFLQHMATAARATRSLADDAVFVSEISFALYLFPLMFGGIGVNLISHILVSHLVGAERRFAKDHPPAPSSSAPSSSSTHPATTRMTPWKAAQPGDPVSSIDTPALVLDLDAFERNLARMATALEGRKVRLRAHAKSHKTPQIALRQMAFGATGICCQKVSEAAAFVEAGIGDVLITNQVVGDAKLKRLAALARRARMGVLVDHPGQVDALAAVARAEDVALDVYVEVNVGADRCGVEPGEPAVKLAQRIAAAAPLRFAGLHCYHGAAQHLRTPDERAAAIAGAVEAARRTRAAIEACGIPVECITGAGTGSFLHERDSGVFNEIQAGSYIFMDRDYADNQRGRNDIAFEHALFVRTTVMSRPEPGRAVVDAGLKASSIDSGMPAVWQREDLRYVKASDEHGVLETDGADAVALGDVLMLVPGHCDPTVNLYDELVCVRGGRVEAIWPIAARGALL